jgi:hypothetical protein
MQVSLTNLSETIIRSSESLSDVCIGLEADMMRLNFNGRSYPDSGH